MFPAMVSRRSFAESTGTRRGKRVARTSHTFFSSSLGLADLENRARVQPCAAVCRSRDTTPTTYNGPTRRRRYAAGTPSLRRRYGAG